MSGESSVRSGNEGQKIVSEILNLIGWNSVAYNFDIDCVFPKKHKPTSKREEGKHGIDGFYYYDNPLYHDKQDVVIISSKHCQEAYPSGKKSLLFDYLEELSTDIDCAQASDEIYRLQDNNSERKKSYKGILFWLSSQENKNADLVKLLNKDIDFMNSSSDIYIVDNKRASFLVSCIKTAESYMKNSPVNFLYQNTGKNMEQSQLLISGNRLPIQLVNSEIIPIIKEENGKITCMIFCENVYSVENLSRLLWFSHKLCGLTNEIIIYFPDYDKNKEFEVNSTKQKFKDESFTKRITVRKWNSFDFVSLKESQESYTYETQSIPSTALKHSNVVPDDIDKILPFGEMLLPKLKTSILSDVNLYTFLLEKGIVSGKKSKDELLPIYSCLLLSPQELDKLKKIYKEKEDRPKEIEKSTNANLGDKNLWQIFNDELKDFCSLSKISAPRNCKIIGNPRIERISNNNDCLRITYKIEKENTTKDFLTGKTYHDAQIEISYNNGKLTTKEEHTSGDTYRMNKQYCDKIQKALLKANIISDDFKAIRFLDFDNNRRIQFMLNFLMNLLKSNNVENNSVNLEGMKFRPDETIDNLPQDLESMKKRVSNLNLYGKELNDTIYLSDETYRKSILCEKVKMSFKYNHVGKKYKTILELSFAGALGQNDYKNADLQISIYPHNNEENSFSKVKKVISVEIEKVKNESYEQYRNKKS